VTRVLVKTGNPAWFVDIANPEGKKVRRTEADQIFDNPIEAQEALAVLQAAHGPSAGNGDAPEKAEKPKPNRNRGTDAAKEAVNRTPPQTTVLSSGKPVTGKTITIRCAWIEGGKNDGTPYETIKLPNGKVIKGLTPAQQKKACGEERVIKVQDLFQVRYCLKHQKMARQQKVNARNRAKTAKKAAAAAASK